LGGWILKADLYLDKIDILAYLPRSNCAECGFSSCDQWLQELRAGRTLIRQCPSLPQGLTYALEVVLNLERILPPVEATLHPQPGHVGLLEINEPDEDSDVLVTGNSLITQEVVLALLSTTSCGFHLLCVDCQGHTVDMALIYNAFTPSRVYRSLRASELADRVVTRRLVLPGAVSSLREEIQRTTGWETVAGPYCVGELPLFVGEKWSSPSSRRNPS
jgi:CO dehydrogenase/acetyl-CoA synthase gamma subunit (corrinoid Fe-S protein)